MSEQITNFTRVLLRSERGGRAPPERQQQQKNQSVCIAAIHESLSPKGSCEKGYDVEFGGPAFAFSKEPFFFGAQVERNEKVDNRAGLLMLMVLFSFVTFSPVPLK